MSQGVNGVDKTKPQGRGRGMARKTSQENSDIISEGINFLVKLW